MHTTDTTVLARLAPLHRYERVCVLTGAGLSGAAGLPTFRGPDGFWSIHPDLEAAMDGNRVRENLPVVWQVWGGILATAVSAGPTAAHRALARVPGTILTQNVDTLHELAGSTAVELHGSAGRAICLNEACGWRTRVTCSPSETSVEVVEGVFVHGAHGGQDDATPLCPWCGSPVRPDVVLFGEALPQAAIETAYAAASTCDLFVAVGTSGTVAPASLLVQFANAAGALCVNLSLHPPTHPNPAFHEQITADAEVALPAWADTAARIDG